MELGDPIESTRVEIYFGLQPNIHIEHNTAIYKSRNLLRSLAVEYNWITRVDLQEQKFTSVFSLSAGSGREVGIYKSRNLLRSLAEFGEGVPYKYLQEQKFTSVFSRSGTPLLPGDIYKSRNLLRSLAGPSHQQFFQHLQEQKFTSVFSRKSLQSLSCYLQEQKFTSVFSHTVGSCPTFKIYKSRNLLRSLALPFLYSKFNSSTRVEIYFGLQPKTPEKYISVIYKSRNLLRSLACHNGS